MATTGNPDEKRFVSRGGLKLEHALCEFGVDVAGLRCADLGCSTGGFTDCLLQCGAAHVTAIDTAYGILDYRLRMDKRVTVLERANALHAEPGSAQDRVDLVVIDLGWTPQSRAIPAALRWLGPGAEGRIITLIKPHYEKSALEKAGPPPGGTLGRGEAQRVVDAVIESMPELGVEVMAVTESPITGGKSSRKGAGNHEWLAMLRRSRGKS
ncbi:MAG: TlyA family RNA methyltransferase [Phycisphaeraceae bacterium]|nr:TlyA family RNA methyltransferase [Phycisphaeraceae bacterium]